MDMISLRAQINNNDEFKQIRLRPPQLRKLIINPNYFKNSFNSNRICEELKMFSTYGSSPKRIQSLSLDFRLGKGCSNKDMVWLGERLSKNYRQLKRLGFKENDKPRITTQGYQHLATALSKLKLLDELTLSLKPLSQAEQSFRYILQSLKGHRNLKKINISLIRTTGMREQVIREQVICDLAEILMRHNRLTELSFFVDGCQIHNPESINNLATNLLGLDKLTKLKLWFHGFALPAGSLSGFAPALRQLESLTSLCLDFPNSSYSADKQCQEIIQSIASLTKLNTLNLDLGIELPEPSLIELAASLKKLTQLTNLRLNFCGNRYLNDDNWLNIVQSIASLTRLTELDLNLGRCPALTEQAIAKLTHALHDLKLESLKLNIQCNRNFSNDNLIVLAQALNNLRKLEINLKHCINLNENGISELTTRIGELKLLTFLMLGFDGCSITDNGLKILEESLSQLTNLTTLIISLVGCTKISNEGVAYLANSLDKLPQLDNLVIFLPRNGQVTEITIESMKAMVQARKLAGGVLFL
jgi:hypothetical protein